MTLFPVRLAALALAVVTVARLPAESLVTVRTAALPPLPDAAAMHLVVLDGQPVALGAGAAWRFAETPQRWDLLEWSDVGVVRGAVCTPQFVLLLLGDAPAGPITRIGRLSLAGQVLRVAELPLLPETLRTAQGAVHEGSLFLAGYDAGGAPRWLSLDLGAVQPAWTSRPAWTDHAGHISAVVSQNSALYLTIRDGVGRGERLLQWSAAGGWAEEVAVPGTVVAGAAQAAGQTNLLFVLQTAERHGTPRVHSYHTITGSWAELGSIQVDGLMDAVPWRTGFLLAEVMPVGQGTAVHEVRLDPPRLLLRWPDWILLAAYLAGMTGIGLYFYLREKRHSTADFFVGGRVIPFWAAGISLYATNTSSISYIAIPAKSYATNWQYLMNNLVAVTGLMFVAVFVVPLLRRLNLMSVFHYLEIRFHPLIRSFTSALCIAMQLGGRMSVVLFLPSLALSTVTGLDVVWSILIMGGITILYTALGGMKAVIWTDVVQLFVMFGGALFAIGFIVFKLDGGVGEFLSVSTAEEKMKLFDWSFDLTKATVWGFVFLVLFDVVLTFPKDQVLMQRVLSTKSSKEAGRSVWTFAAIMVPGGFVFYLIGTALFVFYKSHPERMNPLLSTDATFPLFIAAELPTGVTGLIIAGIFAASMSTLSSIINSVATLASVDFYEKLVRRPNPATSVRIAEWMTVVAGLIGIGLALMLSRFDIDSLFDVSIELSGLLSGGFAGAYTLGMFTRRANWQGVAIGILVSITLTMIAWSQDLVHPYFYLGISILICIVVGYAASHFFPPPRQSLDGLTIFGGWRDVPPPAA